MKINFNDNVCGVKMRVCSGGNSSTEEEPVAHPWCLCQNSGISRVYMSKLTIINMQSSPPCPHPLTPQKGDPMNHLHYPPSTLRDQARYQFGPRGFSVVGIRDENTESGVPPGDGHLT